MDEGQDIAIAIAARRG